MSIHTAKDRSIKLLFRFFCAAYLVLISCDDSAVNSSGDKEPRSFYLGFTPFPHAFSYEAVEAAYDVINQDADMIVQHFDDGVPWFEALDNANNATAYRDTYAANFLDDLDFKLQRNPAGHIVYLAVTPLSPLREGLALHRGNSGNESLAPPWDNYTLDHPDVIKAYTRHCLNMIEHFDPDYFAYAVEANILAFYDQVNGTGKWAQFVNLSGEVYSSIKAEHPDLPVFISLQVGFYQISPAEQAAAINQILPYTDYMAISAYPFTDIPDPDDLPAGYFTALTNLSPAKPVVIAETAWPAEDLTDVNNPDIVIAEEDPQRQQHYIQRLIDEMDMLNGRFITLFFTRDYDDFWESDFQYYPDAQLYRTWRDTGLYDGPGNSRPALNTWLEALARPKY